MSDPVRALADALAADDAATAATLLESASETMEARKQRHMGYQPLAIETRRRTDADSDLRTACTTLLGQGTVAAQAHAELGMKLAGYFQGEVSGTEAAQAAQAATQAHDEFESARETVSTAKVDVGPILAIFGPTSIEHPKGVSLDTAFEVTNLGTSPTSDLSTTVKARRSLAVDPSSLTPLEPDTAAELALTGTPTESGGFTASLFVTGDEVGDEQSVQVVVLSKADYVDRASASLNAVADRLEEHSDSQGGNGTGNSKGGFNDLLGKVETAIKRLDRLLDRIENGRGTPALDEKLQSVERELGAVLNQLSSEGHGLPDGIAVRVRTDTEAVIETLATARRASA